MIWKYPPDVDLFIRENVEGRTVKELTIMLNERFDLTFTEQKVRAYKKNHKLRSGITGGIKKGTTTKYPQEMLEYVQKNARGISNQEMADRCCELFDVSITREQMKNFKANHKISSGLTGHFQKGYEPANKGKHQPPHPNNQRTQFKPGNMPYNHMNIGDLSHTTDGYLVRKIAEPNVWEFEASLVWKQHHGEIPEGGMITYLDGDKDNVDIGNLALITNDVNLEMNRRKLRYAKAELTKTGVTVAKLAVATRKRKMKRTQSTGRKEKTP